MTKWRNQRRAAYTAGGYYAHGGDNEYEKYKQMGCEKEYLKGYEDTNMEIENTREVYEHPLNELERRMNDGEPDLSEILHDLITHLRTEKGL